MGFDSKCEFSPPTIFLGVLLCPCKWDFFLMKATELGAYEIVAFPSGRCVSRPDEKSLKKKLKRINYLQSTKLEVK